MSLAASLVKLTLFVCFVTQLLPHVYACPNGFKSRGGGTTCCRTKICSPGEGFKLCNGTTQHPGEDTCFKCPKGMYNKDVINTAKMPADLPVCSLPDCSCKHDGTILDNKEACEKGEEKICVCDRNQGYFGQDPVICQKMEDPIVIASIQRPGFELTPTGRVKRCKGGYFKSTADRSICLPHTRCPAGHQVKYPGTTTSDVVCEEIPVFKERETITQMPRDIEGNKTGVPDQPVKENSTTTHMVILYVFVGLMVMLFIAVITIYLFASRCPEKLGCVNRLVKRFKMGCCTDSPSAEDEENIPRNTQGEATSNVPVYESIHEVDEVERLSLLTENVERSFQSEIPLDVVPLRVDPSNPSEIDQPVDSNDPTSDVSPYVQADLYNTNEGSNTDTDTGTSLKTVSSEEARDLNGSDGDSRRPIGIVMPSFRMETLEESHGHVTIPTQEDHPVQLVVTGQRARDCPPMFGLSNGDQHSEGLPDNVH